MTFLIRTIDHTATGREIVRDRSVESDRLSIGRATTNDVVVADLAVEQHHVSVSTGDRCQLSIEAIGSRDFTLDGHRQTSVTLDPSRFVHSRTGGSCVATSAAASRSSSTAGVIASVWNAPATCRATTRVPRTGSAARASRAEREPAATSCPAMYSASELLCEQPHVFTYTDREPVSRKLPSSC